MKLTEMLGQYEELLDKKDQLAKDTKDNNAAIDKLKAEIAEMMIDEDIPSQGYGDYVYSLQDKVKYSKRGEAYLQERGLDFFEVLREQGLGELIKETVNAGSLQSAMKEIAEENDGELPPELDEVVSSYEMTDIARRKSTNKALKYPLVLFTHMADQMATSYLETNTGNKKPEDVYLGTEPAAQDPEEFAEAEPI